MQKTLQREVNLSGVGLFSGISARLKICPAPLGHGIVFERTDLPGRPKIPARLAFARESLRSTSLASEHATVTLVEHLLSALSAFEIDHALIQTDGHEIPIFDGSSRNFAELIDEAGVIGLGLAKAYLAPQRPVFWSQGEVHLVALPHETFRISYTLHYPHSPLIRSQFYSCCVEKGHYRREISPCRTFALYEEIELLLEKGLLRGGGPESGVVFRGDQIVNPEGIRFPDEPVRHKILDLIGDLSLLGRPLKAHIIAIRSGHASNVAFAKVLEEEILQQTRESCKSGEISFLGENYG